LALPSGAAAANETGAIAGTVSLEGGGPAKEVEVCSVQEFTNEAPQIKCGPTASDGSYEITGLLIGEYRLYFWPHGEDDDYFIQWYDDAASETGERVSVTANGVTSGVDAVLEEGSTISGTVTVAKTGAAVANAEVCLEVPGFWPTCIETNSAGAYSFVALHEESYRVYFYPEPGTGLFGQSYGGRSLSVAPGFVHLGAKEDLSGVDAALVFGGVLEGTVRSAADGSPLAGAEVCLLEAQSPVVSKCLTTGASGAYRFIGLPTGAWKVVFSPSLRDVYDDVFAGYIEEEDSSAELLPWNDSYPTQWWPKEASFATATPIGVAVEATIAGIDAVLGTPPTPMPPSAPVASLPGPTTTTAGPAAKPRPKHGPLKCGRGFTKRKEHGKERCVRRSKVAGGAKGKQGKHIA
jgi:hypothetical protein